MKKALSFVLLVTLFVAPCSNGSAQGTSTRHHHLVGGTTTIGATNVWQFTDRVDYHDAVVRVSVGNASGTGTIVRINRDKPSGTGFEGYCVTAYHVVRERPEASKIKVHYRSGKTAKDCRIVAYDAEFDAALLWVWVPDGVPAASLADEPVMGPDRVEICGLGGNSKLECCLRSFTASLALPTTADQIYADVSLLPGDSGGPVFNANGKVTGVISGGWFWWEAGVKDESGGQVMATWPARAANAAVLNKLASQVEGWDSESSATEVQMAVND